VVCYATDYSVVCCKSLATCFPFVALPSLRMRVREVDPSSLGPLLELVDKMKV